MTHNPTRSASEVAFSLSLLPYAQLSGDTVLAAPVSSVTFDLSALQSSWGFSEGAWHKATCPWRRLLPSSSTRGIEVVRVFALASRPAMGFTCARVSAEEVAFLRASSNIATVPGLVVVLLDFVGGRFEVSGIGPSSLWLGLRLPTVVAHAAAVVFSGLWVPYQPKLDVSIGSAPAAATIIF